MPDNAPLFPSVERVIYAKNPLNEVVCQLKFPPILRITNEVPSAFQDGIRAEFPEYSEEINALIPSGLPQQVVQLLGGSAMGKRHRFGSRDGKFAVLLDGQALTFVAGEYVHWEKFSTAVYSTYQTFCEVYSPTFLSRIGLRFQNLIPPPADDSAFKWSDYIREDLTSVLSNETWRVNTFEYSSILRSKLQNPSDKLLLQYGLTGIQNSDEKYFRLDFDYYVEEETEPNDARHIIDRLHRYSGNAFRWAITNGLHEALGPASDP